MTDIQKFQNGPLNAEVRVFMVEGRVWFVLSDLARVLGYRDAANAVRLLRDKQWMYAPDDIKKALGVRGSAPYLVTEGGFYRLALRSSRKEAEPFQEWVEDEVLPSIREKGGYIRSDATMEEVEALKEAHRVQLEEKDREIEWRKDRMQSIALGAHRRQMRTDREVEQQLEEKNEQLRFMYDTAIKCGVSPGKLPMI